MAHATVLTEPRSQATAPLPQPIRRALGRIDRRLRLSWALRGLGTAGLIAALGAVIGMAVDVAWPLLQVVRWAIWGAWVVAVLFGLRRVLGPRRGRERAVELAAVIERSHPELGERLTGAVDLLGGPAHGSPVLIAALAGEAADRVATVDPARAVPLAGAGRRFVAGLAAMAIVFAPAVVKSDPFGKLAHRFLMPWAMAERVGRFVVTVAPGDTVTALGEDLNVSAEIAPRLAFLEASTPSEAWLEWTDAAGRTRRAVMTAVDASRKPATRAFRAVVPRLAGSIRYRVVARLVAESRWYRATALEPPAVAKLSARIEPPAYTKFPAHDARDPARIEAWEDSQVTLTIAASRAVRSVVVEWPKEARSQEPGAQSQEDQDKGQRTEDKGQRAEDEGQRAKDKGQPSALGSGLWGLPGPERAKSEPWRVSATLDAGGTTATVTLPATVSGEFGIALTDEYQIMSRPEPPRRLVVRPDGPPTVALRGVEGLVEAKASDSLRVGIAARDDVAVATAELHYEVERAAVPEPAAKPDTTAAQTQAKAQAQAQPDRGILPAHLAGLGTPSADGGVLVRLEPLALRPGDVLSYRVRVADNRPAPRGPNVAWSSARRLTVAEKAEPLADHRARVDRQELQAKLDAIKKTTAENRHESELLRYAAEAVQRGNGTWDRERKQGMTDREAAARDAEDKLQALAADFADDPAFAPLAPPTRQVADLEAELARAALDQARQADDPARRFNALRTADTRLGSVSTRLDELQRRFDELARHEAERQKLQELADRQGQVADRAETADAASRLEPLEAEQNAVRNDLETLLRTAPEMKADVLAGQAAEAAELARRAHDLAARQRDLAARATDLSGKAGVLQKLAEDQRALENEARRLALDVDQPLAENGRGRLNTEALRQAADPIERGDLTLSRQRLEGAEVELRRLARDLADTPTDLKALARRLAQKQERLHNDTVQALAESRGKPAVPEADRAAVAGRLKPLEPLQTAIAAVTASILETKEAKAEKARPPFPKDAAQAAARATSRAAELFRPGAKIDPRDLETRSSEARNALNRLADQLPDPWRKEEPVRKAFAEARQAFNQAVGHVEQHLRETDRAAITDPARAAADLAARLAPVTARAAEAAAKLDATATEAHVAPRVEPQRDRAAHRTRALAEAVAAVRAQAPSMSEADKPALVPMTGWRVVGPFPLAASPPFKPAGPIDPAQTFKGRKKGETLAWKPAPTDAKGLINLGNIYSREANVAAFGVAEVTSPQPRRATLAVGSDDTLTVWVNGKRVYHFTENRSFAHEQAKVEVNLVAGTNRIVIKCGNKDNEWMFAAALQPPPPGGFDPDKARVLRDALAAATVDARAGFDRLEQKLNNQVPADDLADELAEEQQALAEKARENAARPQPQPQADQAAQAEDQRRLATALRGIQAPDAPLELAEAIRQADRAAQVLDAAQEQKADPKAAPAAREAVRQAAEATDALARRLEDRSTPRARAQTLARAERAWNEPDARAEPAAADPAEAARRQHAVAAELARIDTSTKDHKPAPAPTDAARKPAEQAVHEAAALAERATQPPEPGSPQPHPTPADLARARTHAAAALDALARQLPGPTDPAKAKAADPAKANPGAAHDPDLAITPEHTAQARDLARRERQLRERVQAVLADRAQPQRDLRNASAELGRAVAELRDRARELSPRATGPASEAAAFIGEHAPRAMDEAAAQLAQGQPAPARDAGRRAAEASEHGAQAADDLAAALRADAAENAAEARNQPQPNAEAEAEAEAGASHLAAARSAMTEATRDLAQAHNAPANTGPLPGARQAMRGAAQQLQAAVEARARRGPGAPPRPALAQATPASTEPKSQTPGVATPEEFRALQDLVRRKTGRNWGELPGHLRTEILQMSQGRYRDDYARLIQLYFREIAGSSSQK